MSTFSHAFDNGAAKSKSFFTFSFTFRTIAMFCLFFVVAFFFGFVAGQFFEGKRFEVFSHASHISMDSHDTTWTEQTGYTARLHASRLAILHRIHDLAGCKVNRHHRAKYGHDHELASHSDFGSADSRC